MLDLLIIFLGAALLENLVLARVFDQGLDTGRRPPYATVFSVAVMLALLAGWNALPALPFPIAVKARAYLGTLAFVTCAISVAQCDTSALRLRAGVVDARIRLLLPLLVANATVLLFAWLDHRRDHPLRETLVFCLAASLAFQAIAVLFPALRERLEASRVPGPLRGLPITLITAGLVSMAAMGLPGLWP